MAFDILITIGLVILNAFFVASEFAIVKVRSSQIETEKKIGGLQAKIASGILKNLDAYLAATQLGITIASLGLGWIGKSVVASIILNFMHFINVNISISLAEAIALPLAFATITFLHIIFGELAPKSISIRYPLKTALWFALPLKLFYYIFLPFIWILNKTSVFILKSIGIKPLRESEIHSEEEIKVIIDESKKGGIIEKDETELLHNVFNFGDLKVKHVMVPSGKIYAIDINNSQETIINKVIEENYSRIPVYHENLNTIIGILFSKDLLKIAAAKEKINIRSILHPVNFVVLSKPIDDLLKEFQSKHIHMAVVINEFGETEGIVTMEDIIEKIVGEIQDEYDDEKPTIEKKSENEFIVNAYESIVDINKILPEPLPESNDYVTFAGLLNHLYHKIPAVNEIYYYKNYQFKILKVKNNVELVQIILINNF